MNTTKKKILILVGIVVSLIIILGIILYIIFFTGSKKIEDIPDEQLINITELPKEYMDNYFDELSKIGEEGKQHLTLIVVSPHKLNNTYGAVKEVPGPNNKYLLVYENMEQLDKAYDELSKDKTIAVSKNHKSKSTATHYSWGVSTMSLGSVSDQIQSSGNNTEVVVAVIDTGLTVSTFNKYYSGRLKGTYNTLTKSTSQSAMKDKFGHGTHVAGTVADATPSNVKIFAVKATNSDEFWDFDIVAGLEYLVYNHTASVINMSLSGSYYEKSYDLACASAKNNNIVVVAALGNDSTSKTTYPGGYTGVIGVTAINQSKKLCDFSNYGKNADFTAPGDFINSTCSSSSDLGTNYDADSDHEYLSGTSMACPHVAAAVAIVRTQNKNLSYNDTITVLRSITEDLGASGKDEKYGYGLINFAGKTMCNNGSNCDQYKVFSNGTIPDPVEDPTPVDPEPTDPTPTDPENPGPTDTHEECECVDEYCGVG